LVLLGEDLAGAAPRQCHDVRDLTWPASTNPCPSLAWR